MSKKVSLNDSDTRSSDEVVANHKKIEIRVGKIKGNTVKCELCGEHHLLSDSKSRKDEEWHIDCDHVCPDCMDKVKCDCCDKLFSKDEMRTLKDGEGSVGYRVCEECEGEMISDDEREPAATVIYNDGERATIGDYHNHTDGDFEVKYHRTDGWRGYYDVVPSDKWESVHTDAALSYSYDVEQLKEFDEVLREILNKKEIRFARVFTRTSNVFCTGYDFFVEKEHAAVVKAFVVVLSLRYRDPEVFRLTALTGKDPEEWDEKDLLFGEVVKEITPDTDIEELTEKVRKKIIDNHNFDQEEIND